MTVKNCRGIDFFEKICYNSFTGRLQNGIGKNMKKQMKITVVSQQLLDSENGEGQRDIIKTTYSGEMVYENGGYVISYNEPPSSGMFGCITSLSFEEKKKNEIRMTRSGNANLSMLFSEKVRYSTVYDTGIIPIEMTVYTDKVKNNIGWTGGSAVIEYSVEMHGICTEKTRLRIKAE